MYQRKELIARDVYVSHETSLNKYGRKEYVQKVNKQELVLQQTQVLKLCIRMLEFNHLLIYL